MPDEEIQVEVQEEETPGEITLAEAGLEVQKEEPIDPGQNEGKPKVASTDEPGPDTPRFKKVYARLKGAEETIEKLKASDAAKEASMAEVRKHNAALMERIEAISTKAIEAVETVRQPAGEPPEIVSVRQAITDLEERKADAVENLRGKEVTQIDRELRKLEKILDGYEYHKSQEKEEKKREKEKPKEVKPEIDDSMMTEFLDGNTWYSKDPMMTGAALEYDKFLLGRPEWKGKPDKERFKKVRADIEARYNVKQNEPTTKPKPAGAESGLGLQKPGGNLSGSKTVRLTAEQAAVADGLGISRESYAKQLNFLGGAV